TGKFISETIETIGTGFFTKRLNYSNKNVSKEIIDLTIWDLGGQIRFRHIVKEFMMGAAGALLFFDLTQYKTFERLEEWLELIHHADKGEDSEVPILLVGTKADLDDFITVPKAEIITFVEKHDLLGYYETSAKSGKNVHKAVESLVDFIFQTNKGIF
ncbi:MAG: GTP-binding protein, partial [Candidatus Lokiarchaeota archaeon]|nr:GTP-binding protein [Candidatus Lokiarchaeota archaeon]